MYSNCLSDLVSLARGEWFGYVNPEPLIPAAKLGMLADGLAATTMDLFSPGDIAAAGTTRGLGEMLGAVGWYGTHAGSADLRERAADYADALADAVAANVDDGVVRNGAENGAATQGAVGQGLLWASQIEGVDRTDLAETVLTTMLEDFWNDTAGTFASDPAAGRYTITARDAGDITGGVNAADALLGLDGAKATYARFYDQTFNRGRLQRAERPPSRDENAEHTLPLPPQAGGEYGQAAVYNAAVTYHVNGDRWSVADDTFRTAPALYLANQDIWISHWGGAFFQGRGVPGRSDRPV